MADQVAITRNAEAGRFELSDAPEQGQLSFRETGERLTLVHTEVADAREGEGVGSALVREALKYAEESHLTVVPECTFVANWLDKHPERAAELDIAEAS